METIAIGDCFRWANLDVREHGGEMVHGMVTDRWTGRSYHHAWTERNGRVFDWQMTMAGTPEGVEREWWRSEWKPRQEQRYNDLDAMVNLARAGHWGPWESPVKARVPRKGAGSSRHRYRSK